MAILTLALAAANLTGGVVVVVTAAILGLDLDPFGLPSLRGGSAGPSRAEGMLQSAEGLCPVVGRAGPLGLRR